MTDTAQGIKDKALDKIKDRGYKAKNISFLGQLVTTTDPALISEGDYSVLLNFEYTDNSIKPINGMVEVSSVNPSDYTVLTAQKIGDTYFFQLYRKPYTSTPTTKTYFSSLVKNKSSIPSPINITSSNAITLSYTYATNSAYNSNDIAVYGNKNVTNPPEYFLECVEGGITGSSAPNFDSYPVGSIITDGTVKWLKRKGDLKGTFTAAPDDTVVFTDGYHNLIYGGDDHRLGRVLVVDPIPTPITITDITTQVTTLDSSPKHVAILTKASNGNIFLDIGSPLKIRGVNISVVIPNTYTDCNFAVSRRMINGFWTGTVTSDTTYGLSTSGTVEFSFANDDDVTVYYNGHILYWYRLELLKGSHTLPSNITVAYMSGKTIFQPIVDIWDGTTYSPIAFYVQGTSNLQDLTMAVVQAENQWSYDSGWVPLQGTYASLAGKTTYYIGSAFQLSGIEISFPTRSSDGYVFSNTTSPSSIQVYYHDGQVWRLPYSVIDLTTNSDGTITHNQNGKIIWYASDEERPTKLMSDNSYYFYKIVASSAFSSYTYIDQIKTIPKSISLPRYKTCTIWNNRLVLGGNCDNPDLANEVLVSASNSPYIWQGQDSMTFHVGDSEPVTALATLFTRYGTDVQQTLMIAKEKSLYMTTGSTPKDVLIHTVSNTVGVKTQTCLTTCDVGLNVTEGIYRSIVAILSPLGLFMFDNSSLISIDDVLKINTNSYTHGFALYNPPKNHVHFVWHIPLSPDFAYCYEYVFDLTRKKWFQISRYNYYPTNSGFFDGSNAYMAINNKLAKINTGYTMLGNEYYCFFSKGIKPLESDYFTTCNIRKVRLGMSPCEETVFIFLSTDTNSSSSFLNFTSNTVCSFYYLSPVKDVNIFGTVLRVTGTIILDEYSSTTPELYNLAILYKPVRIEM